MISSSSAVITTVLSLDSSSRTFSLVLCASSSLALATFSAPATPVTLNVPEPFFSILVRMISSRSEVFST
jgi:hypothetical protein